MNISRFFGATNREAMRQVRLALGPDALIVSNKRVNGGVEILATDQTALPELPRAVASRAPVLAEPSRPLFRASTSQPARVAASSLSPASPETGSPGPAPSGSASSAPVSSGSVSSDPMSSGQLSAGTDAPRPIPAGNIQLLGAIDDLKGSLESRIDELLWGNQLRRSPQAITLFQTLLRFGFSTALLRAMLKRMPEQATSRAAFQWARNELGKHLPVLDAEDTLWQPGLALALVGPTGVGKTTTIAKLAARCVRRAGPGGLVLLTTDTYRIGAHEQLRIYGQMLHVPVYVVQDVHEFRRALESVRPDQTVLVDNVGISQRDRYIADQAALLAGAGRRVERLLALNASSQGDTLDEVARSYANDGGTPLRGCIVTKIDEASCLGTVLDTAIRYQLPIHYVSNGQKVPENLLFLSAMELVDRALAPVQGNRTLYAPTEADLVALLSMTQPPESPETAAERRRQEILLPQLLTQSTHGDSLGVDELRDAVARLDDDPVLSEACDLWRGRSTGELLPAAEAVTHLRYQAQGALGGSESGIVVHDHQALLWPGRRGVWFGAAWFGSERPLAAAMQQVGLADGWYAPSGAYLKSPSAIDAWVAQIDAESSNVAPPPCHVLDAGTQALLRRLEGADRHWLSACGASFRVHESGEACVASAAARRLSHRPLDPQAFSGMRAPAGFEPGSVVWWVACGPVELRARGEDPLPVQLFSLRAVDLRDGRVLRTWLAVGSTALGVDSPRAARALILRQEHHAMGRLSAGLLAEDAGREPLVDRALYFAQLGLAAWHLQQNPDLVPAARVAARMMGLESPGPRHAQAALLKLFTLKELLTR
ncbi:MAG: flagellar biosynthesis protein FlhF [Castellaniella sp.]|uniref:flagellar biosynthesis protein FlhF n=1 Tax=Castellaniella sp. TaxID=1955812 RepID=UPI0012065140|nr:flagellar biosynthesis protein FlhF [Castellaniella sp.]TAN27705.1 MAG: flagellar biosynthesis protein FlhF [Castellaniella sp.]